MWYKTYAFLEFQAKFRNLKKFGDFWRGFVNLDHHVFGKGQFTWQHQHHEVAMWYEVKTFLEFQAKIQIKKFFEMTLAVLLNLDLNHHFFGGRPIHVTAPTSWSWDVIQSQDTSQLAKGGHFGQKFSKYFFHFTLGQKISKVIVLSWFTFFKGKEVFLNFQFFLSMYSKTQKTKKMRLYQPHLFGFLCFWVHTQEKLKIEKNWS